MRNRDRGRHPCPIARAAALVRGSDPELLAGSLQVAVPAAREVQPEDRPEASEGDHHPRGAARGAAQLFGGIRASLRRLLPVLGCLLAERQGLWLHGNPRRVPPRRDERCPGSDLLPAVRGGRRHLLAGAGAVPHAPAQRLVPDGSRALPPDRRRLQHQRDLVSPRDSVALHHVRDGILRGLHSGQVHHQCRHVRRPQGGECPGGEAHAADAHH
mmetsp:Transcript_14294/g.53848  ORF Transcript_14294/g.53848 Transcript_14294/m.53848 type:complete len:214 (+) Transcript_14294:2784-3425(+)